MKQLKLQIVIKSLSSPSFIVKQQIPHKQLKWSDSYSIKGEKSLNFLFLWYQKRKDLDFDLSIDQQVVSISKTIMNCVDICLPEKPMKDHFKSNEWIKNETKNAINKRDTLFQKWLSEPSNENLALYNKYRNHVTKLIRDDKIEVNQRQLGENRNPKKLIQISQNPN